MELRPHIGISESPTVSPPVRVPLSLAREDWLHHALQDGHPQWCKGVRDGRASLMWRNPTGTRAKANEVSRLVNCHWMSTLKSAGLHFPIHLECPAGTQMDRRPPSPRFSPQAQCPPKEFHSPSAQSLCALSF